MRVLILSLAAAVSAWAAPDFVAAVWPVLERAQCRLCHNDNGVASTTRLRFPAENATAAQVQAFGLSLRLFVDVAHPGRSRLLTKPTNRVTHAGAADRAGFTG